MSTETSAQDVTASEAWTLLSELVASQRGRMMCVCSDVDLAPGQLAALKWLDPATPVPMRELANALSCDNSNVTGIVDRLEDRGLVERRPAPHDRRVKMLCVTPEGARVREQIKARMAEPPEPLLRLDADERRALRDLLRKALGRS
ncbi:MAG TPA: MarR family transcriptional regulator [Capillimicrobium sp.]|nr:MarR family transcriptional regulator [Capillimicrobium sp.]